MNFIVIGNIISLIGALFIVAIGVIKSKKNILIAQCFQCTFIAVGNLFLGGFSGFITNVVNIIRNLYSFRFPFNTPAKIVFIIIQFALGLKFNNLGLIGFLPILAAVIFTWFMDTKSDKVMKVVVISTTLMWTIYDFTILNFTAFAFDIASLITNGIGMYRILKDVKKEK